MPRLTRWPRLLPPIIRPGPTVHGARRPLGHAGGEVARLGEPAGALVAQHPIPRVDELPPRHQPRRVAGVGGVVAHVAIQVAVAGLQLERVARQPAHGRHVVPALAVVLQPRGRVGLAAGVRVAVEGHGPVMSCSRPKAPKRRRRTAGPDEPSAWPTTEPWRSCQYHSSGSGPEA